MDSSSSSSSELGLFRLPRNIRYNIYQRVLVIPHPLYLFTEGTSGKVELFAPDRPAQWLALFHANRRLYDEAVVTLYGSNQFVLVDTTRSQANLLQYFLDLIGSVNAGCLGHICINFPIIVAGSGSAVGEDIFGLKLIQEKCRGLTTLETYVYRENSRGLVAAADQGGISRYAREALAQLEAQFQTFPSLKNVIVRLYDGPLAPDVAELMQSFGWAVVPGR